MARKSRVTGATKLQRLLRRLPDSITAGVKQEIREAAEVVHFEALKAIPREGVNPYATGELRSSFRVNIDKKGLRARIGSFGRNRSRHAHLVEFGTKAGPRKAVDGSMYQHPGTPAQPFLLPAYKKHARVNRDRIRAAINRALSAAARGRGTP